MIDIFKYLNFIYQNIQVMALPVTPSAPVLNIHVIESLYILNTQKSIPTALPNVKHSNCLQQNCYLLRLNNCISLKLKKWFLMNLEVKFMSGACLLFARFTSIAFKCVNCSNTPIQDFTHLSLSTSSFTSSLTSELPKVPFIKPQVPHPYLLL